MVDLERVRKKLLETYSDEQADRLLHAITLIDSRLSPCISNWLNGHEMPFSYGEVSIMMIREKEEVGYLQALIKMDVLLKNPDLLNLYPEMDFGSM